MLPNPYVILGALVGVLLLCAASFGEGHHYASLQESKAIEKAEREAIARTLAADKITHDTDVAAAEAQQKIVTQTIETIKKVPVYVTKKADAACVITRGFVELHNDSARGVQPVPPASGAVDDPAAGIGLSDVAGTVAGNYGKFRQVSQQLTDLQNWVRAQQDLAAKR